MNEKPISEIIAALSERVPDNILQSKSLKGNKITFIPWHQAVRILDTHAPGWQSEVKQIVSEAGKIAVVVRLGIPCAEGWVWREAIGNEDDDHGGYGDPFSNAEAMAFKRAAAKFGVGLYLYAKDAPTQAPERRSTPSAPQQPRNTPAPAPVASGERCNPFQVKTLNNLLETTGAARQALLNYYHVKAVVELTEAQADQAIARLKQRVAEQSQAAEPDIFEGIERPDLAEIHAGHSTK